VLLITLALLFDGEVLVRRARSLIPEHLRPRADRAGQLVYETLGRYFAGSLLLATMNGLYILTVGLVLGVPLILLAAIWVAITNLIPQIGGFLGGVVFVTLALTEGAVTGTIALALFMGYMSTENYLIQPAVVGRAVNLSPPTTMVAALVGAAAAGVPGALIATPLVGSVKALYLAVRGGTVVDAEEPVD
jgi:putative heme transporter